MVEFALFIETYQIATTSRWLRLFLTINQGNEYKVYKISLFHIRFLNNLCFRNPKHIDFNLKKKDVFMNSHFSSQSFIVIVHLFIIMQVYSEITYV